MSESTKQTDKPHRNGMAILIVVALVAAAVFIGMPTRQSGETAQGVSVAQAAESTPEQDPLVACEKRPGISNAELGHCLGDVAEQARQMADRSAASYRTSCDTLDDDDKKTCIQAINRHEQLWDATVKNACNELFHARGWRYMAGSGSGQQMTRCEIHMEQARFFALMGGWIDTPAPSHPMKAWSAPSASVSHDSGAATPTANQRPQSSESAGQQQRGMASYHRVIEVPGHGRIAIESISAEWAIGRYVFLAPTLHVRLRNLANTPLNDFAYVAFFDHEQVEVRENAMINSVGPGRAVDLTFVSRKGVDSSSELKRLADTNRTWRYELQLGVTSYLVLARGEIPASK